MKEWVRGHKHGLAVGGIVCCLLVCGALLLKIHAAGSRAIVLPQAASQTEAVDTFAAYQTRRDEERKTDRAALEKLLESYLLRKFQKMIFMNLSLILNFMADTLSLVHQWL